MRAAQPSLRFGLSPGPSPYDDTGVFGEHAGHPSSAVQSTVLSRDIDTCRFCGFYSAKYQTVVTAGENVSDLERLLTCCTFCEQVLKIDLARRQRSGVLLWLPEIPQATLNRSMFDVYALRITQGEPAALARAALDRLMTRREAARKQFGSDDPAVLVERLCEEQGLRRTRGLSAAVAADRGLRLLPLDRKIVREADLEFNRFPQMLAYWRSKSGPLSKDRLAASRVFEDFGRRVSSL